MFQTLFGDPNDKKIQQYSQTINGINKLEEKVKTFTDSDKFIYSTSIRRGKIRNFLN